jgi:D-sedoheptulose 7-phosphate isomerase
VFDQYYGKYRAAFLATIEALDFSVVDKIRQRFEKAREEDSQLFIVGNGGSTASASHWACDFGKGTNVEGTKRFRVSSLTDNMAWITALGNDISFDDIFVEQMQNTIRENDIIVGLSVSGSSENVIKAFEYAKQQGADVIALVGAKQGKMASLADIALVIPSEDYGVVEDVHMFVNHVISQHIKQNNLMEAKKQ